MKSPERWKKAKEILYSVLETGAAERARILDERCGDDDELRREIESLINAHDKAAERFESPALEAMAAGVCKDGDGAMIGNAIAHYEVTRKLGSGGMGDVFLAEDTRLGRKVALKILPSFFTQDKDRVRRFQQEAKAASALNHPSILTIHEIGHVDSTHYIATEFVDGETLRERMVRRPLTLAESLDIAMQVASALATAQEAGIVHRDIKPENIMLRRDGIAKVLDFGLAKLTERQERDAEDSTMVNTAEGVVMGTAQYMSPEQARGVGVDARTDIWSVGCVIYEMLAGRAPFTGDTASDVIVSILEREPPPVARYCDDAPVELDWLIKKTLKKDRDERCQTSKELLADLRSIKQRLDFEAELERSSSPGIKTVSRTPIGTDEKQRGTATEPLAVVHPTSSAEYIVTEIKRHKIGMALVLAPILLSIATALYFYYWNGRLTVNSMAVIPFVNEGADPDTEYLSDGITESLTNSLSQLPNMRMIARTSVQNYKGRDVDPQTVARELGVQAVLMGRVVRRGDDLSIRAELVDTRDNRHLWGEQYNRGMADILEVQREIAREISERLRARLTGEERQRVTRNYTDNVDAYQLYLRGRHHWNKRSAEGLRQAIQYFQQAIDRDPDYALAYSGLADCYSNLQGYAGAPPSQMLPRSRAAATRALEIDPSLSEAHASLGLNCHQSWRWADAEREFKRAIELNANYGPAHQWYSLWLEVMGRSDEALAENQRAQEVDPLSPIINTNYARFRILRGEVDLGIDECRKVLELSPDFPQAHMILAQAYQKQGHNEEAIAEFERAVELSGRSSLTLGALGYGYATAGRRSDALAILKELEERSVRGEAMGAKVAWIYAGLGDNDRAFASIEKEFDERGASLTNGLLIYPFTDNLRRDSRYADLLRRMGLPISAG